MIIRNHYEGQAKDATQGKKYGKKLRESNEKIEKLVRKSTAKVKEFTEKIHEKAIRANFFDAINVTTKALFPGINERNSVAESYGQTTVCETQITDPKTLSELVKDYDTQVKDYFMSTPIIV